jgi:hypothetical protein
MNRSLLASYAIDARYRVLGLVDGALSVHVFVL